MKNFTHSFIVVFLFFTLCSTNPILADSMFGDPLSAIGDGSSERIEAESMDSQVYTSVDVVTDDVETVSDNAEQNDNDDDDDEDDDNDASEEDSSAENALLDAEDKDEIADNSDDENIEVDDCDIVQISGLRFYFQLYFLLY